MGMNQEDFNSIFRIVSSVLLFGSMQFKQERNSDQATLPDNTVAQKIAHLLGELHWELDFRTDYIRNSNLIFRKIRIYPEGLSW